MHIGSVIRGVLAPVLELRDFRLIWSAGAISSFGSIIFDFTLLWYVAVELESVLATSAVVLAMSVPVFVVGLPSGALVDRFDARQVMIWMDLVRAVLVLCLPLLDALNQLSFAAIVLLTFARTSAEVLFSPAEQSLIVSRVPADDLPGANAFNISSQQFIGAAGPVVAGISITVFGSLPSFYLDAATFVLSAYLLNQVARTGDTDGEKLSEPFSWSELATEVRDGAAYIWRTRPLRVVTLVSMINIFGFAAFRPVSLLYFQNELGWNSATYGVISSIGILGLAVGSASSGLLIKKIGAHRTFGFAHLVLALATIMIALVPLAAIITVFSMIRSLGIGLVNVSYITILQRHTDSIYRGRVFATADTLSEGGRPVALLAGSGVADLTTARFALGLTAGAFLIAAVVARVGFVYDIAQDQGRSTKEEIRAS